MFYKKKNNTLIIFILGIVSIIPISVFALCKVQINIESSVSIERGFRVDYLIKAYALYTDSELAKYEKTSETKCYVLYVGEEKYNICSNILIKDNTLHKEGSSVELNQMKIKVVDDELRENCEMKDDKSVVCPTSLSIIDRGISTWYYYESVIDRNGYVFDSNDKQIMNFQEYVEDEYDLGIFLVNAPQTFTMPGHHILFSSKEDGNK